MTAVIPKLEMAHDAQALDRLAAIEPGEHWIVSCILPLSPEFRFRGRYLAELKNQIRDVRDRTASAEFSHADREAIERDCERIVGLVRARGQVPDVPGLALFACEALGLLVSLPLPRPSRLSLVIDHVPHLRELRAVEVEFGRVITVVVERMHARLFEVDAWGAEELPGSVPSATRGGKFHSERHESPGWGEKEFHARIARERERHYDAIVHRLKDLDRERPIRGIVLAGHTRDLSGLARFLDESLAQRLIGTVRFDARTATAGKVKDATFGLYAKHERESETARVADLLSSVGEGWAVNGVQATMRALARGQLRTLFVRAETEAAEADEAIEEALAQRVGVVLVHEPDTAAKIKHLAGFLRFR